MHKTLKFRIIFLCFAASLLTALGVTVSVLSVTQSSLQRQLLEGDRSDRIRTAELMASRLDTLKSALTAEARNIKPALFQDPKSIRQHLLDQPSLSSLFDGLMCSSPDGTVLARLENGRAVTSLPNLSDRSYLQHALQTDQAVVSEPLLDKVTKKPTLVIAVAVRNAKNEVVGVLTGLLLLQSDKLFASPGASRTDGVRDLVMNRAGQLLWHTNAQRVMGSAANEPGLADAYLRWSANGSPIETTGSGELSENHLVSMAGLPLSDWVLVRLVPESTAMAALQVAQRTAWATALAAGLISAMAAGMVAWNVVRPIGLLRDRAERLLAGKEPSSDGWPQQDDEIGAMSKAFQALLQSRHQQHAELQAVLDNAEVGLALTRDGRFETVSRQFCLIFGYTPEQVIGQSTRIIYPSDAHYAALAERAQPAFMQHGLFDGEVELIKRNGQTFRAHMRGRAVTPGDRSKGTIWVIADETQDYEQRERLSWAASHDRLTGLPNRARFETLLEEATAAAAQAPFCALFIDLDRFKQVNDSGGHAAGDEVLRALAKEMSSKLRKSDTVARLGGDEFAVLLPHCPIPRAQVLAEMLRATVDAYRLTWEGATYSVGASIGLVPVNGGHASAADVLRAADEACYAAKRGGKNQVAIGS